LSLCYSVVPAGLVMLQQHKKRTFCETKEG
jgi:hypothetical protein